MLSFDWYEGDKTHSNVIESWTQVWLLQKCDTIVYLHTDVTQQVKVDGITFNL